MKIKKANQKYTKGKGLKWKKGQSCTFNPAFNKHRVEARRRGVFGNAASSNLTQASVARHNNLTTESICNDKDDAMSIGRDTVLTAFTNCSLPSFSRLLKNWNSGSLLHKEMVAVLAAVTEILQKDGGQETETDYFAALMTTLDVVETDESITAVISLLAMLIKRVNESVLKAQSKKTLEVMVKLLVKYMNSDHCALLRNLLSVVYSFFKIQTHWPESCENLSVVLEFITHQKPKVRKSAQGIVQGLLIQHIPSNVMTHPCANQVGKFCVEKLESSAGKSKSQDVFYILQLLERIFVALHPTYIKKCCETIFRIMTLSDTIVTLCGLKSLLGLFSSEIRTIPEDLNARIITALYDYQPNIKDSECLSSWLLLMGKGLKNLFWLNEKLCYSHLTKFFAVATKCFLNETEGVMYAVEMTLKELIIVCMDPNNQQFQKVVFDDPLNNAVNKMFHSVEEALSYQYHNAWRYVLPVLAEFFKAAGKHCFTAMMKCLQALGDLHDSYNFPHLQTLEKTIATAIKHMGPKIVLKAIPLQFDGERPDFPRSWMLPLLRDNIQKTELQFFVNYFLPLAAKMRKKALVLNQEGKIIESKLFNVLCSQIWSLLPGFCTEPTDLKECFKQVAQTLGMILKNDVPLRVTVLSSLRLLINKNLDYDENREEISHYAKNYLPILFNLYSTQPQNKEEEKVRLAVLETIKVYLQITKKDLCSTFFAKAMEKLKSEETEVFNQQAMIDICKALIPYVNEVHLKELFDYSKPLLLHTNNTTKKKAYGVVKDICSSNTEACKAFVKEHFEELRSLLSGSVSGLIPATRALRLNCLQCIVSHLTEDEKSAITDLIPEAVLCTKEHSIKARTAAYNLLVEIGNALKNFSADAPADALKEFLTYLLPGLIGRPHFVSATILAICRVIFEFKDLLDHQVIDTLIDNMCELSKAESREIVKSILSFFKILFATVTTDTLAQHVQKLVLGLTSMSVDNQRPLRFKAKEIFIRLIRKFGYEMISKLVPKTYQKQLNNIRKVEARKKNKKNVQIDDDDSEDGDDKKKSDGFADLLADSDDDLLDDDEEDAMPKSKKMMKKRKTKGTYIEENAEDDIVDFLDPAANKKFLTLKPEKVSAVPVKKSSSFPIAPDGRLIIEEDDGKPKMQTEKSELSTVMAELGANTSKNKRKLEDSDSDDEVEQKTEKKSNATVQKGIYRSLEPLKKKRPGEEFKAKKAGGDIKKGKLDPYAYLPLNRMALNRRKQAKLKGQYDSIVKAAKRGATVGLKRKARQSKRRRN